MTMNAPREDPRRAALWLAGLVLAAIGVRAILYALRGEYLDWDEAMYLLLARNIVQGDGIFLNDFPHTALAPLVPFATAALSRLTGGDLLIAQRILSTLSGGLLLVPVFYLLRRHFDRRSTWIAVSLLVAWPALVDVAPKYGPMWFHFYAGTEPTYVFLLFAAIAAGEAALDRRGASAVAFALVAGGCLGLAFLARSEAVVFGGAYAVVRAVRWVRDRDDAGALRAAAVTAALGFLLVAGPQLWRLHRITGAWVLSGQPAVMAPMAETLQDTFRDDRYLVSFVRTWYRLDAGHSYLLNPYWGIPENMDLAQQKALFAQLARVETPTDRSIVGRTAARLVNLVYMLWTLTGPLFAPLVALGIFFNVVNSDRHLPTFVLAALAASLVTSLYLAVLPRFYLYLVPAFALWTAMALGRLADRVPRLRFDPAPAAAAALIVASGVIVATRATGESARNLAVVAREDREAGERLAAVLPGARPVMHWHPRIAYWAGWPWRTMPMASLDAIAHYAARLGVKHILLVRGGYSPIDPGVPHFVVTLDERLLRVLELMNSQPNERHTHPPMILNSAGPVAGYPAGVLELDPGALAE